MNLYYYIMIKIYKVLIFFKKGRLNVVINNIEMLRKEQADLMSRLRKHGVKKESNE